MSPVPRVSVVASTKLASSVLPSPSVSTPSAPPASSVLIDTPVAWIGKTENPAEPMLPVVPAAMSATAPHGTG